MLRFRLRQLHVPSLDSFFVPLPKLTEAQQHKLSANLRRRGFDLRPGGAQGRQVAARGGLRISIDGRLGIAKAGQDILDAIAPAIPEILAKAGAERGRDETGLAERYFSVSVSGATTRLQFFPRMESLRTWTCLRRDGLCGLTPDEAVVLRQLLGGSKSDAHVECVTARPRDSSKILQVGRRLYYSTSLPVSEFLSTLGTIESQDLGSASYLRRASTLVVRGLRLKTHLNSEELGEWCSPR